MLDFEKANSLIRYEEITGHLYWKKPGPKRNLIRPAGHCDKTGYTRIMIEGKMYLAHRLIWLLSYKEWPASMLDHKDRNPENNKLSNLELSNHQKNGNNSNAKITNIVGIRGISLTNRGKFSVKLRRKYLGIFDRLEDAKLARENFLDANK